MSFLFDPARDAATEPAFWLASTNPSVVVICHAAGRLEAYDPPGKRKIIAQRVDPFGRSVVLAGRHARHRIRIVAPGVFGEGGYAVPTDDCLKARLAALEAYHFPTAGSPPGRQEGLLRPSAYQRYRLSLLLAILDGRDDDSGRLLTNRELARELVYPGLAEMRAVDWKTSSQRRQVQRLVAEANHMSASGFRDILRPSPRSATTGRVSRRG